MSAEIIQLRPERMASRDLSPGVQRGSRRHAEPDLRLTVLILKFAAALAFWGVVSALLWSI